MVVVVIRSTKTLQTTAMSIVLPGDRVPAQHVNLKLGPGLQQLSTSTPNATASTVIATRAGELNHSANRSKWWIEGNSRRVSFCPPLSAET